MLGKRLSYLREKKGFTKTYVAKYLGVTRQAYSNYESEARDPDTTTLLSLANLFNVTVDFLLGNDLTEDEKRFLEDVDLDIEELRSKYKLTFDGKEVTDEELKGALAFIKASRSMKEQ